MKDVLQKSQVYWRNAGRLRLGHYIAAEAAAKKHKLIGIPSVVLSAVVATSVFATLSDQMGLAYNIITGTIALLAAVLASLQTFLNFSDLAERHKTVAAKYFSVRRQIDMFQLQYHEDEDASDAQREEAIAELKKITDVLSVLSSEAPTLSEAVYRRASQAFDESHPDTALDEIRSKTRATEGM